jgi:hypothetical protein
MSSARANDLAFDLATADFAASRLDFHEDPVRKLVSAHDVAGTIALLEDALERATEEDREELTAAATEDGPADMASVAREFLFWATKPSGGIWANMATARLAVHLRSDGGFLEEIVHHWTDAERVERRPELVEDAKAARRGHEQAEAKAFTVQRIKDEIDWLASEGDGPEIAVLVETAGEADLAEIADEVLEWARARWSATIAKWGDPDTALTAQFLERTDMLKELAFTQTDWVRTENVGAVLAVIESRVESWRTKPHDWPGAMEFETARRADLRAIAETFLGWSKAGAISSAEAW